MLREEIFSGCFICCDVVQMGNDCTIAVYGGDAPHVGSVVMATACPSPTGEGIRVTSSVLNAVSHKDEVVARTFAETVAKSRRCTAVCSCGIHIDNISPEQIKLVQSSAQRLLGQLLESMED